MEATIRFPKKYNPVYDQDSGDCTIRIAKTKALISLAVTAKLICVFVFAYAKSPFSHDGAHVMPMLQKISVMNRQTGQADIQIVFVNDKIK